MDKRERLYDKFLGCVAGTHIGSSMGAVVEGMDWPDIEAKYGTLDRLMPYEHYGNGWKRAPGTTEDGVERQKLMITAIMDKKDRVNAEDVKKVWLRDILPNSAGMVSEPFEATLLALAKTGIPGRELGRYCDYSGLNSFARACHPVGLINAGDPRAAAEDVMEVGSLYQVTNSRGLKWAQVTAVAIAEGTRPEACVDSVTGAVFDVCDPDEVVRELDREMKKTAGITDFRELRSYFDGVYSGRGMPYYCCFANEVVTRAFCIFRAVRGDVREAVIAGVNFGRDTDCTAAIAAGISGALSGAGPIPAEWIKQLDEAAENNPYTNTRRSLAQHAEGLLRAYEARFEKYLRLKNEMLG